jgi:hypothetical protein
MADKITIEVDLETGDIKSFGDTLEKAGNKAGKNTAKEFADQFNKKAGQSITDFSKSFLKLGSIVSGVAVGFGAIFGTRAVQAASIQEEAITRLNRSLQQSGDFSLEASRDLQAYAAQLQEVTEFGDETIINQIALAKSFGASNEQAKLVVEAATGMSKALGIDLESATRNAAKTLGGYAGELGETIPQLKAFTQEQLQAGAGVELLNQRFAEQGKSLNTFSFFTSQLSNTFGDLLESIGAVITQSPVILRGLKALTTFFKESIGDVKSYVDNINLITDAIIPLSKFGDSIITFVVSPLELLGNIFGTVQASLNTFVSAVVAGFGDLGGAAARVIELFGGESETTRALKDFQETSNQVFLDNANNAVDSFGKILDFPLAEKLAMKNEEFRLKMQEMNLMIQEEAAANQTSLNESIISSNDQLQQGLNDSLAKQQAALAQQQKQVNSIVNQGIARSISGGIQNITQSLIDGENAFSNFGNFILNTFGDLAIQLGQFFIAQGIAVEALKAIDGTGAIAAGAGLIALGTLIKSFASSGKSSSGGGAGVAAVGAQPAPGQLDSGAADPQNIQRAQEQTQLSINVEGSLVREQELNGFIADILEEGANRNSTVIPSLRTSRS